jgi:hypothetical protein
MRCDSHSKLQADRAAGADPDVVSQNVEASTAFYTTMPEAAED